MSSSSLGENDLLRSEEDDMKATITQTAACYRAVYKEEHL